MSAAVRKINSERKPPYAAAPGAAGKNEPRWFDSLKRRSVDTVGPRAIDWPDDLAGRHQVFRDWHAVAMRRVLAAKIGTDAIGLFWRFMNLRDRPGLFWPKNELLADLAGTSTKTISRQISYYGSLGLIQTRRRWVDGLAEKKLQARTIELTFPADLSQHDFDGLAFTKSTWRKYVKDDDAANSDGTVHGPVMCNGSSESDGTIDDESDGTVHGPGNVEWNSGGQAAKPPPATASCSTSNVCVSSSGGALDAPAFYDPATYDPAEEADSSPASHYSVMDTFQTTGEETDALHRECDRQACMIAADDNISRNRLDAWRAEREDWICERRAEKSELENRGGYFDE